MRRFAHLALIALLAAGCGTTTTSTQPTKPAPTANSTAIPEAVVDTPDPVAATPRPDDFQLRVKTLKQECFGSAGCNVTFTIRVAYTGAVLTSDAEHQVTYKVTGGSEPLINTFTLAGGQATVSEEEFISTDSATARLRAKVTEVE